MSRDNLFNCSLLSRCRLIVPLPGSDPHTWEALQGGRVDEWTEREGGRKSTSNPSFPADHISAVIKGLLPFYKRSKSKSRPAGVSASDMFTAAADSLPFPVHSVPFQFPSGLTALTQLRLDLAARCSSSPRLPALQPNPKNPELSALLLF